MSQRATERRAATNPRPSERWSAARGAAMLAALSASGESDRAFARRTGTAPHRISYWRKKLTGGDSAGGQSHPPGFMPVRVVEAQSASATANEPREVEALLPRGVRLVFRGDWDRAALQPWLAVLGACDAE